MLQLSPTIPVTPFNSPNNSQTADEKNIFSLDDVNWLLESYENQPISAPDEGHELVGQYSVRRYNANKDEDFDTNENNKKENPTIIKGNANNLNSESSLSASIFDLETNVTNLRISETTTNSSTNNTGLTVGAHNIKKDTAIWQDTLNTIIDSLDVVIGNFKDEYPYLCNNKRYIEESQNELKLNDFWKTNFNCANSIEGSISNFTGDIYNTSDSERFGLKRCMSVCDNHIGTVNPDVPSENEVKRQHNFQNFLLQNHEINAGIWSVEEPNFQFPGPNGLSNITFNNGRTVQYNHREYLLQRNSAWDSFLSTSNAPAIEPILNNEGEKQKGNTNPIRCSYDSSTFGGKKLADSNINDGSSSLLESEKMSDVFEDCSNSISPGSNTKSFNDNMISFDKTSNTGIIGSNQLNSTFDTRNTSQKTPNGTFLRDTNTMPNNINKTAYVARSMGCQYSNISSHSINNRVRDTKSMLIDDSKLAVEGPINVPFHGNYAQSQNKVRLQNRQYISSDNLFQTYQDYGSKYFSTEKIYGLVDYVKILIKTKISLNDTKHTTYNGQNIIISEEKAKSVNNFVKFLEECNFNNHAFDPKETNEYSERDSYSLENRSLVLCAAKNGRLDIFSPPVDSNMIVKRGDIVIVDGDRGKDLMVIVEPVLDRKLTLFINFLKKKSHFDSLVTDNIPHDNGTFIEDLVDAAHGKRYIMNTMLYDINELTQFVTPMKNIIRFATSSEVSTNLHLKLKDELKVLHVIKTKFDSYNRTATSSIRGGSTLSIRILNTEFQYDRKKLTIYYTCQERNDFREFVKDIFKLYKTRIWLCAVPNNLQIEEKYFRNTGNELSMLQDMVRTNDIPYVAYNSSRGQPNKNMNGRIQDLNNSHMTQNPMANKWRNVSDLVDLSLDDYQIGIYHELISQLFK